jgi:hypothetical protein
MIILLEEGYKQKDVVLKDEVFGMSSKIFDFWDLTTEWSNHESPIRQHKDNENDGENGIYVEEEV